VANFIKLFLHNLRCNQSITLSFDSDYATSGKNNAKKGFMKLATGALKFRTINVVNLVTLLWASYVQHKANKTFNFNGRFQMSLLHFIKTEISSLQLIKPSCSLPTIILIQRKNIFCNFFTFSPKPKLAHNKLWSEITVLNFFLCMWCPSQYASVCLLKAC
jgi:hypothetical protein